MAIARPSAKLRGAFSRGAGFGIARRLLRGFSLVEIGTWLESTYGRFSESEFLELISHGQRMREAGSAFTQLRGDVGLDLSLIPVNPWASPSIYEGARTVSEIIMPWQIQATGESGEWYHRFRHVDVISVDEISEAFDTWIAQQEAKKEGSPPPEALGMEFNVGAFVGVAFERAF